MIAVLTPEQDHPEEHDWLNCLLENGLEYCHIRKYGLDKEGMRTYLGKIHRSYRDRLILHAHHDLATEFDIRRLHIREEERLKKKYEAFGSGYVLSTSVHAIADFNVLGGEWNYAFFSPMYPSISKSGYGVAQQVRHTLSQRQNQRVKLIGLGGIDDQNCQEIYEAGADGIALMGGLWQHDNPLAVFLRCRKKDQSY